MNGEQIHTLISMNHVLQISCKRVVDVIRVIELSILYIKTTCLSVCVGSAWKILPSTAHTHTDIVTVQGWPPVLPPLYGQGTGGQQGGA